MNFAAKTIIQKTEDRRQKADICHPSSVIRFRAFTLVEMVVAIALLAMVILFASGVFKSGIESYRTASAQAEIMAKLRVITQQLDSDFRGLRKDAPLFIWFEKGSTGPDDANRFDQIMFFADGDFQSTRLYSDAPIVGNVARIQYGQARSPSALPAGQRSADRILARRIHISSFNFSSLPQFTIFPVFGAGNTLFIDSTSNNSYEYDSNSLSQWQAAVQNPATNNANTREIIVKCFDVNCPRIDFADVNTLHLLMTEGVGSFSVQWGYYYAYQDPLPPNEIFTEYRWWPSVDPDGNPATSDSDFDRMMAPEFGFYFNAADPPVPPLPLVREWFWYGEAVYYTDATTAAIVEPDYPQALKFTFTLYDSRGVFKNGQTFTHIVYPGD